MHYMHYVTLERFSYVHEITNMKQYHNKLAFDSFRSAFDGVET